MGNGEGTAGSTETGSVGLSTTRQRLVSLALAVLGLALAATGIRAVFTTDSDTGAAALLTLGTVLVLFAALGDRLESLRYGDLQLVLLRKADERRKLGDVEGAEVLRRAADTVGQRATRLGRSYEALRGSMPAGVERTAMMERIIRQARKEAEALSPDDQEEVLRLHWTGSQGARVWALGVLQVRTEFATIRAVLEAVQRPDQMFDQFHALLLAKRFVSLPATRKWPRERIEAAVQALLEPDARGKDAFDEDSQSRAAAQQVLQQVNLRRDE
jgi:hypothetical protein